VDFKSKSQTFRVYGSILITLKPTFLISLFVSLSQLSMPVWLHIDEVWLIDKYDKTQSTDDRPTFRYSLISFRLTAPSLFLPPV
jgi:hypothetical protein